MPSTFVNMWKGTWGWIKERKHHWNFPSLTSHLPKNIPVFQETKWENKFYPCKGKPEAEWLLRRTFLSSPSRSARSRAARYHLFAGSRLRAGGREKEVSGLGSPCASPEAEALCSHMFVALHCWTPVGHPHPVPAVPWRKASAGPSCLGSRSTSLPEPRALRSWNPTARGSSAIFGRAEGNLHGPSLPTGQVGVTKRELLCTWQQVPKNPAQVSRLGQGAGGSCGASLLQGIKCRA